MTALAISLAFLGALAFAAFWLWLKQAKPQQVQDVAPLEERVYALERDNARTLERVSTLELATLVRKQPAQEKRA